jgi:hypothetical protein
LLAAKAYTLAALAVVLVEKGRLFKPHPTSNA